MKIELESDFHLENMKNIRRPRFINNVFKFERFLKKFVMENEQVNFENQPPHLKMRVHQLLKMINQKRQMILDLNLYKEDIPTDLPKIEMS